MTNFIYWHIKATKQNIKLQEKVQRNVNQLIMNSILVKLLHYTKFEGKKSCEDFVKYEVALKQLS